MDCFVILQSGTPRNDRCFKTSSCILFGFASSSRIAELLAMTGGLNWHLHISFGSHLQSFLFILSLRAERSNPYQPFRSIVKSLHSGFLLLIRSNFFFLEPPLICFSLLIASTMLSKHSKYTNFLIL